MSKLLLSFVGDDFTGSTDAMESLARNGLRTVLFTSPPTREQLSRYPDLQAFGVAGTTRSVSPDEMERVLRPVFTSLREIGAPIVHYKMCSTFDSSPSLGSIGRVIDVGMEIFGSRCVPLLVGAPSLGRYCVFGNLFARAGTEPQAFRLDRHPSMAHHPTTPMNESDLRLHLAKQTQRTIGLLDVLQLESGGAEAAIDALARAGTGVVLIDALFDRHLGIAGHVIDRMSEEHSPLFVVGSSGVESAMCAHWDTAPTSFSSVKTVGLIIAVCGSCSPVTAGQIRQAVERGFAEVVIDPSRDSVAIPDAIAAIRAGRSVVIRTATERVADARLLGSSLGRILRETLAATKVRRVLVAGGDTSGAVAQVLGIESMEMIGELTRGSPLVRVSATGSPADGIEMTFKGGQIGPPDFFIAVQRGVAS